MNSGIEKYVSKAYFISPIVNLERLILDMIKWAGATEQELEEKKIIPVDFGDDLSWDYLQYVRNHKISWMVPTDILFGSNDNMQSLDTIKEFCSNAPATITVMDGGEHWFHTKEQLEFLDEWIKNISKADSHMIKIMFVCHGNICRSPMAEFVLKDMIKRRGFQNNYVISSSATSTEEIFNGVGNPVYPPARAVLEAHGIDPSGKRAIQLKASDYDKYDLFIGMDNANIRNMTRILGGDKEHKIHKLMEYTGSSADVSDPWYTRDFDRCYKDIYAGCKELLNTLVR